MNKMLILKLNRLNKRNRKVLKTQTVKFNFYFRPVRLINQTLKDLQISDHEHS